MRMRVVAPYKSLCLREFAPLSGSSYPPKHPSSSSSTTTTRLLSTAAEAAASTTTTGSRRGRQAVSLLPTYLADARAVTKYSPETPNGALQLGVAESYMLEDWLVPALNTAPASLPADAIYYQPTAGREDFRRVFAKYMEDLLELPEKSIDLDGLVVGAGCNAVLENLCLVLAEAGDSVLIPTPYYAAFEFDLVARAGLQVQPVTTMEYAEPNDDDAWSKYYPTAASLDAAYERAVEAGSAPRILLISHPHNPLGVCYPEEVVQECIDWCRARQVHLISDEIYSGSVYRPAGFVSALKLAKQDLGPYVHWVYALSKDFALSGLRVGAVYTENKDIQLPLQKLNDLCQISSATQLWTKNMMERQQDDGELWVSAFRRENHKRLEKRCKQLTAVLNECQIPYLPPTCGLFCWIDLSQYLPAEGSAAERERHLYLQLVQEFGLLLTPGLSMRNEEPGFFRCVYTAATDEEFALSLERFRKFAASF